MFWTTFFHGLKLPHFFTEVIMSTVHILPWYLHESYRGYVFQQQQNSLGENLSRCLYVSYHRNYKEVTGGTFFNNFFPGWKSYRDVCTWIISSAMRYISCYLRKNYQGCLYISYHVHGAKYYHSIWIQVTDGMFLNNFLLRQKAFTLFVHELSTLLCLYYHAITQ